jgi:DnaK suppressor protein
MKARAGKKNGARPPAAVPQAVKVKADSVGSSMPIKVRKGEAGSSGAALPNGYHPNEAEPFMNDRQRLYFRNKLLAWKDEIVRLNRETLQILTEDSAQLADIADRATFETDRALELRARDRQRKLISKIDAALARIDDGSYGYCEETGEPISLKRLDARPIATLSIEAQERHERRERVFRED